MPSFPPPPPPYSRAVAQSHPTLQQSQGAPRSYNDFAATTNGHSNGPSRPSTTIDRTAPPPPVSHAPKLAPPPPPPPPPRSYGSQSESLSGLTPPSAWNTTSKTAPSASDAARYGRPPPPAATPLPSTSVGAATDMGQKQQSRFPPPPPPPHSLPTLSTPHSVGSSSSQQQPYAKSGSENHSMIRTSSPLPPSFVLEQVPPRSPAASDITFASSHYLGFNNSQTTHFATASSSTSPLSESQRSQPPPPPPPPALGLPPSQPVHSRMPTPYGHHIPPPLQPPAFRQLHPPHPPPPPLMTGQGCGGTAAPMPPPHPPPTNPMMTAQGHPPPSHVQQQHHQQQVQHQLQQQYQQSLQQREVSSTSGPRLHPEQLPRPPIMTHPQDSVPAPIYFTRQTLQGLVPPLADTRFQVVDDGGTSSPSIMRSSLYQFPQTRREWHELGDLPLGVVCTPLAVPTENEYVSPPRILPDGQIQEWIDPEAIPLIRLDNNTTNNNGAASHLTPPPRCASCQAYANPFMEENGLCNFCGTRIKGDLQHVTPFGTVEYPVDGPYITRERPIQPVYLYAIDLTCPYILEYLSILDTVGYELMVHWQRQLSTQPASTVSPTPPRMGVCVYSSAGVVVHHRQHSSGSTGRRSIRIMSDVTEQPFAPLPLEDWTVEVATEQGYQEWKNYLTHQLMHDIPKWKDELRVHGNGKNAYGLDIFELSCGGAALAFVADALQVSGGTGTVLSWRRPNFGIGRISHRDERRLTTVGGREDYTSYTPLQLLSKFKTPSDEESAQFYRQLGADCVKNRVSLHVVMHCDSSNGQAFLDLATLGELCRATSGMLLWIPMQEWQATLTAELQRQVQRFMGWDAVFKLRCSAGIQVKSFLGHTGVVQENLVGSPELELASVNSSTSVAVELEHRVGGIPKGSRFVFLQAALLYTNMMGQRRVRVSTLALPVSAVSRDIFRAVDFSTVSALLMRMSAYRVHQIPSEDNATPPRSNAHAALYHECIHILSNYRKIAAGSMQQLLLPEMLRTLPLVCMCLMKSPLLRPSIPTRLHGTDAVVLRPCSDERAYFHFYAAQANPASAMLLVYPRLFSVSNLESGAGEWVEASGSESSGFVALPPPLYPSMESLDEGGIILMDGGLKLYLWIGRDVPRHVRDMARAQPLSEWNPAAHRMVWQLRAYNNSHRGQVSDGRPLHAPLEYVFQPDGEPSLSETTVLDKMIEDAIGGEKDYGEFLIRMHQTIRAQQKS